MKYNNDKFLEIWKSAKHFIEKKGYKTDEIIFRKPKTKNEFLEDYAWVVFASGFRVKIIEKKWGEIKNFFFGFNIKKINNNSSYLIKQKAPIDNKGKIKAIIRTAKIVSKQNYKKFFDIEKMEELPFIGKITKYHLARNWGIPVGKPDRWMIKLAKKLGFNPDVEGVELMFQKFHHLTGEDKGKIDAVLWRACEQGWLKTLDK